MAATSPTANTPSRPGNPNSGVTRTNPRSSRMSVGSHAVLGRTRPMAQQHGVHLHLRLPGAPVDQVGGDGRTIEAPRARWRDGPGAARRRLRPADLRRVARHANDAVAEGVRRGEVPRPTRMSGHRSAILTALAGRCRAAPMTSDRTRRAQPVRARFAARRRHRSSICRTPCRQKPFATPVEITSASYGSTRAVHRPPAPPRCGAQRSALGQWSRARCGHGRVRRNRSKPIQ